MGGSRRGVDMGPSAFRIAGLGETDCRTRARRCRSRRPAVPDPRNEKARRSRKKFIKEIAKVCDAVSDGARVDRRGRAAAGAGRRSQPGRGIGRGVGRSRARRGQAARAALDRRARRHEHAGEHAERQRARHAAGRAARSGACGASSIGGFSPTVLPSTRRSSACATSTSAKKISSAIPACTCTR